MSCIFMLFKKNKTWIYSSLLSFELQIKVMKYVSFLSLEVVNLSHCDFLHFQRNSSGSENPSDVFRFIVEERVQCCQSQKVRYTQRVDYLMQLPVPIEAATNRGKDRMSLNIIASSNQFLSSLSVIQNNGPLYIYIFTIK